MKNKAEDATIEEMIADLTNYEDPDTILQVATTKTGGVAIGEFDGSIWGQGETMREALLQFGSRSMLKYPWSSEFSKLDWISVTENS